MNRQSQMTVPTYACLFVIHPLSFISEGKKYLKTSSLNRCRRCQCHLRNQLRSNNRHELVERDQ
jgi:hypothetical protein